MNLGLAQGEVRHGPRAEFRGAVDKFTEYLRQGVHLLMIDLLPPGPRGPQGFHKAHGEKFGDENIALPAAKPLTLAS